MTEIRFDYSEKMQGGLFAVAQHASKGKDAGILNAVKVTPTVFVATNRYTVGEFTHTEGTDAGDVSVLIPRSAAEWLAKQTPKAVGFPSGLVAGAASVVVTPTSITIRWNGDEGQVIAVTNFPSVTGNFPPVQRLFPSESNPVKPWSGDSPVVRLNPEFLEFFTRGAKRIDKGESITFTLQGSDNPHKPGPVLVELGAFRGLIQPNLLDRRV